MKSLLYKEFRLAMHPLCYVFALVFPLMVLIPNFPLFVGTLYIIPGFTILFLGANKGKQSNDLFYSALLPIRKKDIVFARMMSVMAMEIIALVMMAIMFPLKLVIESNTPEITSPFPTDGIISGFAFALVGYVLVNAVYFLMFYKSGRSVTAPTLIGTFGYVIYILIFTSILPAYDPKSGTAMVPGFYDAFVKIDVGIQVIYLVVAILLYLAGNFLVYKKASQELLNADL